MNSISGISLNQFSEKQRKRKRLWKDIKNARYLYLLIIPVAIYLLIFRYWPMYGIIIGFKDYRIGDGVWGSSWLGFSHFIKLFKSPDFYMILGNSLKLNILSVIFQFPVPIILALLINEVKNKTFKKGLQSILYLPHFLSWVILAGIIIQMLSPSTGIINGVIKFFGGDSIFFMSSTFWWVVVFVVSGIWKESGWGTIIYLAAISNVDSQLYEAAQIDGATKMKQIWYITLPSIKGTIIILLILRMGGMMDVGFDQIYNLSNTYVRQVSDVFSTYVYRMGIEYMNYSYTTAIGLFQSIVNLVLLMGTNFFAKKIGEQGIW